MGYVVGFSIRALFGPPSSGERQSVSSLGQGPREGINKGP